MSRAGGRCLAAVHRRAILGLHLGQQADLDQAERADEAVADREAARARDRGVLPASQIVDVQFTAFMADAIATTSPPNHCRERLRVRPGCGRHM
jgi:hypothetical protein